MAAMGLINLVPAQQPTNEGKGGINDKDAQQNEPGPEEQWVRPCRIERHHRQYDAQKTTAGIAHEDFRRRKIPDKETQDGHRQYKRSNGEAAVARDPVNQASTDTGANRLDAGQTINTIHEVVEIEHPDQIERCDDITEPAETELMAEQIDRRHPPNPEQCPDGTTEMRKQAPTRGNMPMVIQKTNDCDPAACPQQSQRHRPGHGICPGQDR
ncbi:hypothetical protein D3C81_606340 [compost metagenome]